MATADASVATGTYVHMALGGELYALPVGAVLEVGDLGEVTPVPGGPAAVLGVCSLRGNVLPVVDPGPLLGTAHAGTTTRLIVTERDGRRVGLAVDAVTDVGPLPGHPEPAGGEHLSGAIMMESTLVGLLELDSMLAAVEARP